MLFIIILFALVSNISAQSFETIVEPFKIEVTDLDLRSFDHGGGIVQYKGKEYIRNGALLKYFG